MTTVALKITFVVCCYPRQQACRIPVSYDTLLNCRVSMFTPDFINMYIGPNAIFIDVLNFAGLSNLRFVTWATMLFMHA